MKAVLLRVGRGRTSWADDGVADYSRRLTRRTAASASTRRLVFAIGGPYGHGAEVRARAHKVVALSGMVLNHELARVVLVEQLYRVSTLLWGGSYHH